MEDGDGDGVKPCFGALVLAPGATPSPDFFVLDSGRGNFEQQRPGRGRRQREGWLQSVARFVSRQLGNANRYVDPVLLVPGDKGGCRLHYSEIFQRKKCLSCNAAAVPVVEVDVLSRFSSWKSLRKVEKIGNSKHLDKDGDVLAAPVVEEVVDDRARFQLDENATPSQVQRIQLSSSQVQSLPPSTQALSINLVESLSLPAAETRPCAKLELADEVTEKKKKQSQRGRNHAVAGALAGVFVSLCLHPLDTVKTVIQSRNTGKQAILPIVGSIISARGVSGLYRGLGSNLASSAPISAIYTFTYEAMKAALLPRLPEEYHSLAHCAAGGCASIATSLVYTPSERVKQQMQIGTIYRNSWLAFVGIVQRGGFPALYTGWEAVLCRNVPQSVIKFFTYEALKHRALRDSPPDTHLTNLQTLAFGGVAGSTAALFTTPFDVVKTRLQTQTIGSQHQYSSVLNALHLITRDEGIRSLYRGLIPRLAIYVSQGALFFASYEFFKRALTIESRKYESSRRMSSEETAPSSANNRGRALLSPG